MYTSPHLVDFRERIRINGVKIPKEQVVSFVQTYKDKFAAIQPSFFEYTFGMAISYFAEENVDIAIMETGMGGRLDSTNVVTPLVSVITNIGLDHIQFLGDTLEKIAAEKAGIIKEETPVIIGETQEDIKHVFEDKAKQNNSSILYADKSYTVQKSNYLDGVLNLSIESQGQSYFEDLKCPLSGNYQKKNILTTLALIDELNKQKWVISKDNIYKGISNVITNTRMQGRWQALNKKPLTICDTGHNIDGISQIVNQIDSIKFSKLHFVLGMVADKNIDPILNLLPKSAQYYFCKANIPRGLDENELKQKARNFSLTGNSYHSVKEAFESASKNASENDMVFVGGSTFVVAEVL